MGASIHILTWYKAKIDPKVQTARTECGKSDGTNARNVGFLAAVLAFNERI